MENDIKNENFDKKINKSNRNDDILSIVKIFIEEFETHSRKDNLNGSITKGK